MVVPEYSLLLPNYVESVREFAATCELWLYHAHGWLSRACGDSQTTYKGQIALRQVQQLHRCLNEKNAPFGGSHTT